MAFNLSTNVYESDVNQNNNTSIVHVAVTITTTGSSYSNYDHYGTIVIDGTSYSHGPYRLPQNSSLTLQSQKTITHNDATGEYTAGWSYSLPVKTTDTRTGSGSIVLTTIPRASQPTFSSNSVILGNAVTINMNRKNTAFTHTLSYSIGNLSNQTSGLSASSGITTSATFTPPKNLANQFPNSTNGNVVFTCQTYNGSTLVGTRTATLVVNTENTSEYQPTITLSKTGSGLFGGKYINGASGILVEATTSGKYSASINSYSISGANKSSSNDDLEINPINIEMSTATQEVVFTGTAIDSRGYSSSGTTSITLYRYVTPTIEAKLERCDSSGSLSNDGTYALATIKYTYHNENYGNNIPTDGLVISINGVDYEYSSSDFTETTDNGVVTGTGTKIVGGGNLSINYKFDWDVVITDAVGQSATVSGIIQSSKRIINTRPRGKGIAFGKFAETDDLLESDWKIKAPDLDVTNDVEVGGDLLVNELNLGSTAKSNIQYSGTSNITQILPELSGIFAVKPPLTPSVDANFWQKVDFGAFRIYYKYRFSGQITFGAGSWGWLTDNSNLWLNLPVGLTFNYQKMAFAGTIRPGDAAITANVTCPHANTQISVTWTNKYAQAITTNMMFQGIIIDFS